MHYPPRPVLYCIALFFAVGLSTVSSAQTNPFSKAQVADRIRKVEDGVDEFQKYLNNRGDDARIGQIRHKTTGREHVARVQILQTPTPGGTKPSRQKTISKTLWTI